MLVLEFILKYNEVFIFIGILILLSIIYYQSKQIKYLIFSHHHYLDQYQKDVNFNNTQLKNAKINTALLLLAEMKENAYYMVSYLYFFQKRSPEIRIFKSVMTDPSTVSDKVWRTLSYEALKYFPKEVMQELVTYYTGITELRIESNRTLEEWADLTRKQLLSYQNSIDIMESELGCVFSVARGEVFEVSGVKLRLNRETGDVQ